MKHFILSFLIIMGNLAMGNAETIVLHCETAGSLADTLEHKGLTEPSEIHSLTISGHLHAGDFLLLKKMPLDSLDLSAVEIDAFYGAGTYEPGMFTGSRVREYAEAEIPINAFSFRSNYNNGLSGMESLVYIKLPASLKSIGKEAFAMTSLESIELPEGLETIETDAFLGCPKLEEVMIPASVTSIGQVQNEEVHYGAFACCESLRAIYVADGNENYQSEEGILFSADRTMLLQYPAGKEGSEYRIPDGVQRIAHRSFEYCRSIEKITIPASVEVIERAFWDCEKLTELVCERQTPPRWRALGAIQWVEPFDNLLMREGTLTVPAGCKSAYAGNFDWEQFRNIREAQSATSIRRIETSDIRISTSGQQIYISRTDGNTLDIQLYDMTGKLVRSLRCQANEQQLPVPGKGIYIIDVNGIRHKCICK